MSGDSDHLENDPSVDVDANGDEPDEDDETEVYTNSFYRFMTVLSAGLVMVLGVVVAAITRTVEPPMPMQVTVIAAVVTAVLFVWYLLGMRSGLILRPDSVVVTSKIRRYEIPRQDVVWIDNDESLAGGLQPAGRSMRLKLADGATRRVVGALPVNPRERVETLRELQEKLGTPEDAAQSRLDQIIESRFGAGPPPTEHVPSKEWSDSMSATDDAYQPDDDAEADRDTPQP